MKRIALPLLLLAGCGPKPVPVVWKGSSGSINGVEFSGGHGWFPDRDHGVCFGTIRRPGGPVQYAYALFLRTAGPELPEEFANEMSGDGTILTATHVRSLGEFDLRVKHSVGRDSEGLEVNGQRLDLSRGRVFHIDLRSPGAPLKQTAVSLPEVARDGDVPARGAELIDLTW